MSVVGQNNKRWYVINVTKPRTYELVVSCVHVCKPIVTHHVFVILRETHNVYTTSRYACVCVCVCVCLCSMFWYAKYRIRSRVDVTRLIVEHNHNTPSYHSVAHKLKLRHTHHYIYTRPYTQTASTWRGSHKCLWLCLFFLSGGT